MKILFCAPKRAHFFLVLTSFFAFSICLTSRAHTVVLSEYSLEYVNEQWVLSFDQKTRHLRDAIYASTPDLRGINLNSEVFLEATANHITSNLTLMYNDRLLRMVPQHMQYGGLRFESTFSVEGLPEKPDYLTIKADGFDAHEHSVVLIRMTFEKEGYLNYFNKDQKQATFDFATHHYAFEGVSPTEKHQPILYVVVFLVLAVVMIRIFSPKKAHQFY